MRWSDQLPRVNKKKLIKQLDLTDKINIIEVKLDYFKYEYFPERPVSERLVNKRLDQLNLNIMRDWKVALNDYINDYNYTEYLL